MNKIFLAKKPDRPETACERGKRIAHTAEMELRRNELINSLAEVVSMMRAASGNSNAPLRAFSTHPVILFGVVRESDATQTRILAAIPRGCVYSISDGENTVNTVIPAEQHEWFEDFATAKGWKVEMVSGQVSLC